MSCKSLLSASLLAFCLTGPAFSQALIPRTPPGGQDAPPLECATQTVSIDVQQQVARVRIEQVFVNRSGRDLEAVYFLPLHESASISRLSYWVKGQEITGSIKEKAEARQEYETEVARNRDPALLEHADRNLFRMNIFPVSASEPMRVVVEYSQLCTYENGVVRLRYPLTAGGAQQKIGQFQLDARVADQKPIESLLVPSHGDVRTALQGAHNGEIHYRQDNFTPSTDFALEYRLKSKDFGVSLLTHKQGEDGYFMLVVAPQEETSSDQVVKKDVIFVFDRSGSMQGEKIEQARAALKFCLQRLTPTDRFRLLTFSDTVESGTPELVPADSQHVQQALQEVARLEAGGGTNICQALQTAMQGFDGSANQKVILFMTDGLPTVGEQKAGKIVEVLQDADRRNVRLFAFGVGDDLDDYLLLKLASDHRGALQYVRAGESIESKISSFFAKISTPLLVNLKIDWGQLATYGVYPPTLPDVFKGSQLLLVGRYRGHGQGDVVLQGDINGHPRTFRYPAHLEEEQPQNPFLERLWAKQRVDYLVDQMRLHGENAELKQEVITLSKRYMFITPYTSLLAKPKPTAAASAPGYPTGADPILSVLAPRDARVTAYFPWGETRALRFEEKTGLWKCRFLVPAGQPQGACKVVVLVAYADGHKERQVVCFEADDEPPTGRGVAALEWTAAGWSVRLAVDASADTHRVMARLPNGKWLELRKDAQGRWLGSGLSSPGACQITLLDHGHNRTILELEARR